MSLFSRSDVGASLDNSVPTCIFSADCVVVKRGVNGLLASGLTLPQELESCLTCFSSAWYGVHRCMRKVKRG